MIKRLAFAILGVISCIPLYYIYIKQNGLQGIYIIIIPILVFLGQINFADGTKYGEMAKVYASLNALIQYLFIWLLSSRLASIEALLFFILYTVLHFLVIKGLCHHISNEIEWIKVIEIYESTLYDLHVLLNQSEVIKFNQLMESASTNKLFKFIVDHKAEDIKKFLTLDIKKLADLIEKEKYMELYNLIYS